MSLYTMTNWITTDKTLVAGLILREDVFKETILGIERRYNYDPGNDFFFILSEEMITIVN
jgi:hypothetical protein